jgi:hypothetical protein
MVATENDVIQGPSQGTLAKAISYAQERGAQRFEYTKQYLTELFNYSTKYGLRFEVMAGQWADETGVGTTSYWVQHGNPAGIGALQTSTTGEVTYVGLTYETPKDSALAHLYHMLLYTKGSIPSELQEYKHLDPRADAVARAGYLGIAKTLKDLTGRWAANPEYARQIAAHMNRAFPGLNETAPPPATSTIVFGRVPHPVFIDKLIPDYQNQAWNNLGQRTNKGVVWHRMVGNLMGTDNHFRTFANARQTGFGGLTDYGVGVAAADGTANDGVILRWNHPLGVASKGVSANRAGWATGPYDQFLSFGDGRAFTDEFGTNAINRDQISIEISGNYTTPLSEKSRNAIALLTAYWADQAKIPWDVFPLWPGHGYSFVRWHVEFCGEDDKPCPGAVVRAETNALIERTAQFMKTYQVTSVPIPTTPPPAPVYSAVSPITTLYPWNGKDRTVGTIRFFALRRSILLEQSTPVYKYADQGSGQVRAPLEVGSEIMVDYWFKSNDGKFWFYTPEHWRIPITETNTSPEVVLVP